MMGHLRVIEPGLLTTIQDLGRWGFQSHGVTVCGPMDMYAHRTANTLVGNHAEAATLEITVTGPELQFEGERSVAVAGAEFEMRLDGRPVSMHQMFTVGSGSRLRFGRRIEGARAYLAVAGGIDVPLVLRSRATDLTAGIGGLEGRALKEGDRLPFGRPIGRPDPRAVSERTPGRLLSSGPTRLRVLPGPHVDRFADTGLSVLQDETYVVDPRSNRMGLRLSGGRVAHRGGVEIISDATPMGSIQVPATGLPILLMADRQTTGGYPTVAVVISADLRLAGQLAPGDVLSFVVCSLREALAALIAQERELTGAAGTSTP
jgi:biotin-dependent carboxylase-like uncharacterized protein